MLIFDFLFILFTMPDSAFGFWICTAFNVFAITAQALILRNIFFRITRVQLWSDLGWDFFACLGRHGCVEFFAMPDRTRNISRESTSRSIYTGLTKTSISIYTGSQLCFSCRFCRWFFHCFLLNY